MSSWLLHWSASPALDPIHHSTSATVPCRETTPCTLTGKLTNHLSLRAVILCKKKQLLSHSGAAVCQGPSTTSGPYPLLSEHFQTSGGGIERAGWKSHERGPSISFPFNNRKGWAGAGLSPPILCASMARLPTKSGWLQTVRGGDKSKVKAE